MIGNINRVTYNYLKKQVDLHLKDGDIKSVPMSEDEWKKMLDGDVIENFNRLLNE